MNSIDEDGGTCRGISYQVAGMQSLVDAVRQTGRKIAHSILKKFKGIDLIFCRSTKYHYVGWSSVVQLFDAMAQIQTTRSCW
jgi:hypothetical protein